MRISIENGRLIDPAQGLDAVTALHIADGRIVAVGEAPDGFQPAQRLDASGRIVCPGLVDLRARLREPGQEHKASIASETTAAAAGGITTLCIPPDTDPVIDSAAVVELIHRRTEQAGLCHVLPLGALTTGLAGEQLAEMAELRAAGCVGVSNAQAPMRNTLVMRRAMEYAASHGLTLFLHAEDAWLGGGAAHEGAVSTRLGLPGIPEAAETVAVARDLILIEQTGARAHFCGLSSARAVRMIAQAQQDGLPVSADATAHHLHLTELDLGYFNPNCHVRPPLRSQRDREGLRRGLQAGTLAAICSDHQPHDADAKLAPFSETEPGISGLETLLPLTLRLADEGVLSLTEALAAITWRPAQVLGIDAGSLAPGRRADLCIFDPVQYWTVEPHRLRSRGRNTPFLGWELKGRVIHTVLAGRLVYSLE